MTATVMPRAARESPRLPEKGRANATADMSSARTAETCTPEKTTYDPTIPSTTSDRQPRVTPIPAQTTDTSAATTTR